MRLCATDINMSKCHLKKSQIDFDCCCGSFGENSLHPCTTFDSACQSFLVKQALRKYVLEWSSHIGQPEDIGPSLRPTRHQCTAIRGGPLPPRTHIPALMSVQQLWEIWNHRRSTGIRSWRWSWTLWETGPFHLVCEADSVFLTLISLTSFHHRLYC